MSKLKVAILYYSSTGANHQIAKWATETAESAGAEVRRRICAETAPQAAIDENEAWKKFRENEAKNETEASLDDLEWADVLIFSIPTRYGNMPSQMQAFLDTTGGLWFQGKLTDKVATGFSTAMNPHGGQETTVHSFYKTMMHWGCIIVPPGYTADETFGAGGNPYGTSASIDQNGGIKESDNVKAAIAHQVKRTINVAQKVIA